MTPELIFHPLRVFSQEFIGMWVVEWDIHGTHYEKAFPAHTLTGRQEATDFMKTIKSDILFSEAS